MTKLCQNCNKELKSKTSKKFCDRSCSAKYNNSLRKTIKNCKNCGLECKNIYCSVKCQQDLIYKTYIDDWLNYRINTENNLSDHIRKYLFKKYNDKCSRCGWDHKNPITNKCPLEVEHIDGNSSNNKPENLTLLCPNCHSLTSTYKALNKGNGRYARRQRYREGKSY